MTALTELTETESDTTESFTQTVEKIEANLASVIRGKPDSIRLLLLALLAGCSGPPSTVLSQTDLFVDPTSPRALSPAPGPARTPATTDPRPARRGGRRRRTPPPA